MTKTCPLGTFHGYGAGADPDKCDGHGYDTQSGGTVPIMGKKMCPVLCGENVPVRPGHRVLASL